ncbi:hypothetical protein TIFTF001_035624 [Ficus carica]|uniref:Gag-pol polyprotein n=1 Tax=Ficus carica TaxID=3494 RepID=A0AA88E2A9_FICCA|nr:hypothetical protein TIFTF001_035624 [Ficus carica]
MVRLPRTMPVNPPELDLATVVANLQRQLLEQQRETDRLREQLARMNQRSQDNQPEVPIALAGVPVDPPLVREDLLYERFRRMRAPKFKGPMDPIAADNWLINIQVILKFKRLTEQEKVFCASFILKKDARHWGMTTQIRRDVMTIS